MADAWTLSSHVAVRISSWAILVDGPAIGVTTFCLQTCSIFLELWAYQGHKDYPTAALRSVCVKHWRGAINLLVGEDTGEIDWL